VPDQFPGSLKQQDNVSVPCLGFCANTERHLRRYHIGKSRLLVKHVEREREFQNKALIRRGSISRFSDVMFAKVW
jgi:hypothetical protein